MEVKKDKPKHLGRGLQSLLGPITSTFSDENQVVQIPITEHNFPPDKHLSNMRDINIDQVKPNRYQPRQIWNEEELKDLAESIKAKGIIQPIVVRQAGTGFEVIAGERRLRAAKLAGLQTLPAIIRSATDQEMLEIALIENINRSDLNPVERARAYKNYIITFNITQEEAAGRLGQSRPVITNYLRLLDLPEEIQEMLTSSQLSMGHAKAILSLPTDDLRRKLANRAMAGRLSVREVERLVRKYITGSDKSLRPLPVKPPHIIDLENRLTSQLGTKVSIETRKNGHRGKIIIEFYSIDDFDRITEQIGLATEEKA
jgi:ParB family transcriptional regulator, chromosome partitioning protein